MLPATEHQDTQAKMDSVARRKSYIRVSVDGISTCSVNKQAESVRLQLTSAAASVTCMQSALLSTSLSKGRTHVGLKLLRCLGHAWEYRVHGGTFGGKTRDYALFSDPADSHWTSVGGRELENPQTCGLNSTLNTCV